VSVPCRDRLEASVPDLVESRQARELSVAVVKVQRRRDNELESQRAEDEGQHDEGLLEAEEMRVVGSRLAMQQVDDRALAEGDDAQNQEPEP